MKEQPAGSSDFLDNAAFEVELKFPVHDKQALMERLRQLGATFGEAVQQLDCYYQHPCRDFAATDEALRIRSSQGVAYVTYKGPRLDGGAKTRRELEYRLENEDAFKALLEILGFQPVAVVEKQRRTAVATLHDRNVEFALDEVASVGSFVEIETLATANELAAAQNCVSAIAEQLGLANPERRSYLGLLLERLRGER